VAQEVCDRLVDAGVTSVLNFAPVVLSVPDHVDLRKVDLAAELQILSFHETRKALAGAGDTVGAVGLVADDSAAAPDAHRRSAGRGRFERWRGDLR
jgi:redox-sensing transcriptional repressor